MRQIDEIIVHCSATRVEWFKDKTAEQKRDEIRRWHKEDRGWKDIGYTAIIDRDGTIAWGRDLDNDGDYFEEIGAHVAGRNARSIGFCLIGGHGANADDPFSKNFTLKQDLALRKLIAATRADFPSIVKVSGHNEYAAKACPGFNVDKWYKSTPGAIKIPVDLPPALDEVVGRGHGGFWAKFFAALTSLFRRT